MRKPRKEWLPQDTATLKRLRGEGKPATKIAEATGHSLRTIRNKLADAGERTFGNRGHWSRRDWLLADAAGLDFQMHYCPT